MKVFFEKLGPGLLYAGAAVGVSHLVQSTRAGADYGLQMLFAVLLANVLKYPFFKAGPIYASTHQSSLLEGFHQTGKWAMMLFYLVTLSTMFAVQAVVTLITSSLIASIFQIELPLWLISLIVLSICSTILVVGKYHLLDRLMKTVIVLLTITTFIALGAAIVNYQTPFHETKSFSFSTQSDLFFLIALIGWMPAPLDISLWHSEWTLAKNKDLNERIASKNSLFDFNVGYWGTTVLAIAFVALGSLVLRGSGQDLSSKGTVFASQIIDMYTSTLGRWSFAFIALAAFTTMFSTTITVLDAYPRILKKSFQLTAKKNTILGSYGFWLTTTITGALFILIFQLENMKQLVDFATTISFLTAPILACLIFYIVQKKNLKIFNRIDNILAWLGILFLFCFSLYYLWVKL